MSETEAARADQGARLCRRGGERVPQRSRESPVDGLWRMGRESAASLPQRPLDG